MPAEWWPEVCVLWPGAAQSVVVAAAGRQLLCLPGSLFLVKRWMTGVIPQPSASSPLPFVLTNSPHLTSSPNYSLGGDHCCRKSRFSRLEQTWRARAVPGESSHHMLGGGGWEKGCIAWSNYSLWARDIHLTKYGTTQGIIMASHKLIASFTSPGITSFSLSCWFTCFIDRKIPSFYVMKYGSFDHFFQHVNIESPTYR